MTHLPNLNALRFIAASLVIVHHIELYKSFYGLANAYAIPFFALIGKLGVVLFFNLSGFLITLLLLTEQREKGKIGIRKFYSRRILRIWPLYFFVLTLAFFTLPAFPVFDIPSDNFPPVSENFIQKFLLFIIILPNLVPVLFDYVPYAAQLWSVGTEEQFYLFWPWVLKGFKKHLLPALFSILLIYYLVGFLLNRYSFPGTWVLKEFWYYFNINCMAMGGIFALVYFKKMPVLRLLFMPAVFFAALGLSLFLLVKGVSMGFFHYDVYGFFFCIIILNLSLNPRYRHALDFPLFFRLGQISYGLYMYHLIFVTLGIRAALYFNANYLAYPVTFLGSILTAHYSYHWFEQHFIRMKLKYT